MANISPLRALLPDILRIENPFEFFSAAKKKFNQYLEAGFYQQAPAPAFYICRIQTLHRSHTGIIARAHIQDYIQGTIKKHENTLTAKEDKMLGLFQEIKAMVKPILLTYPNAWEIDAFINRITIAAEANFALTFDSETHTFWEIDDAEQIQQLALLFQTRIPTAFICDGHHRAASAERLYTAERAKNPLHTGKEGYNYLLAAYFPISEIEVHNFNRVVVNINMPKADFFAQLETTFNIEPKDTHYAPQHQHQIAMCYQQHWYQLTFKAAAALSPKKISVKNRLDVELLNKLVFQNILNITDVRTDANVQYIEGVQGSAALADEVAKHENSVGFLLYPVALEDLIAIANADDTMPPKSTWIEPRMRNGMLVQSYE